MTKRYWITGNKPFYFITIGELGKGIPANDPYLNTLDWIRLNMESYQEYNEILDILFREGFNVHGLNIDPKILEDKSKEGVTYFKKSLYPDLMNIFTISFDFHGRYNLWVYNDKCPSSIFDSLRTKGYKFIYKYEDNLYIIK